MKLWWDNIVRDYLTFTAKERRGVFFLLALGLSVFFIARHIPVFRTTVDKQAFQQELADLQISIDTNSPGYAYHSLTSGRYKGTTEQNIDVSTIQLFPFDPNTLDAAGWKKLGIRERTIQTIHRFLGKGYKFRQPDDIRKIYGLQKTEADRIIPFIRIAEKESQPIASVNAPVTKKRNEFEPYKVRMVDINLADTTELIALPGIGSKLAARIVHFREKLGGFCNVDQLGETYGISDSTFRVIKNRLQCIDPVLARININTTDAAGLKKHPYINWNIANAIVNYRSQHGNYTSIRELDKIEIITEDFLKKIAPYLTF